MDWFRFYHDAVRKRKVQALSPTLFRFWVNVMCLASEHEVRGMIPPTEDISFALHLKPSVVDKSLATLVAATLLDSDGSGGYTVHNWDRRQKSSDDVAFRVAEWRRNKKQAGNVTSNNPQLVARDRDRGDTEQSKNRGEEKQKQRRRAAREAAAAADFFPAPLALKLYEQTVGSLDPHIAQLIDEAVTDGWTDDCQIHCFHEASEHNARNWKYIDAIRKRHQAEGCYASRRNGKDEPEWTQEQMQQWANSMIEANQATD